MLSERKTVLSVWVLVLVVNVYLDWGEGQITLAVTHTRAYYHACSLHSLLETSEQ